MRSDLLAGQSIVILSLSLSLSDNEAGYEIVTYHYMQHKKPIMLFT